MSVEFDVRSTYCNLSQPYQLYNVPREKLSPEEKRWIKSTLEELANYRKSPKRDSKFFKNNMQ